MHSTGLQNADDTICADMVCSATRQTTFHRMLLVHLCVYLIFLCGPTLDYRYYLAIRACKDISASPHKQTARMSLLCKFHNVPIRSNDMGRTEI